MKASTCLECGADLGLCPKGRTASYWKTRKFCNMKCVRSYKSSILRVLGKIEIRGEADCWPWHGNLDQHGYGYFVWNHVAHRASRFAYSHFRKAPLHPRLFILHSCDNPACVNPFHLRHGTCQDNADDMVSRNRQSKRAGVKNQMAKLTEQEVREILRDGRQHDEIAADYGVSRSNISLIKERKRWAHVDVENDGNGTTSMSVEMFQAAHAMALEAGIRYEAFEG